MLPSITPLLFFCLSLILLNWLYSSPSLFNVYHEGFSPYFANVVLSMIYHPKELLLMNKEKRRERGGEGYWNRKQG